MTDEKKDWVSEVVGDGVKIEKSTQPAATVEVEKSTPKETVKEVSLSQEKKVTKKEQTKSKKTVKLFLDGKLLELSVDDRLPEGFLQTKLKEGQRYVPVNTYRDIIRQLGEFGIPRFSEEKFTSGKNKSNVDIITYRAICEIERYKDGSKTPVQLKGVGYSAMSAGVLLSDAIHGNMHTLYAKALRDALKYTYNIMEFPELDVVDTNEQGQINELKAKETIDNVVKGMQTQNTTQAPEQTSIPVQPVENTDIQKEIIEDYNKRKEVVFAQLAELRQQVEKKHVLGLAKEVKDKFGEEHKEFISKIIRDDFNSAK